MANSGGSGGGPRVRTIISQAFEGDDAPGALSVAIVSLVELAQIGMPSPDRMRKAIGSAGFKLGRAERAEDAARNLALDVNFVAEPVRNLRSEIYGRDRYGEPVVLLLSEGDTPTGKMVFCSTFFRGAIEADAVKAVTQVTNIAPFTGATVQNSEGFIVRRVFWDVEGAAGARGFAVSGPENVDDVELPRAFTLFNKASAK